MRLEKLTIKNFRSITRASSVSFSNMTVLLGANNEGKSNVLRALVLLVPFLTSPSACDLSPS